MARPSIERVQELLSYDAESGTFHWRAYRGKDARAGDLAGSIHKSGYCVIVIDQHKCRGHHLVWLMECGVWPEELDHINGVRADNRFPNLRECDRSQNQQNRSLDKRNKAGFTGVSWDKNLSKWRAKICVNRKQIHIGVFTEKEAAAEAYRKAKAEHHTFNPIPRA